MKVQSGAFFSFDLAEGFRAFDEPFREVVGDVEGELPADDRDARRGPHWASELPAVASRIFALTSPAFRA